MTQKTKDELYYKLTSRKFILALLAIAFAVWNYYLGDLTAAEFQASVVATVTTYGVVEGVVDYANAQSNNSNSTLADEIIERIEEKMKDVK